MDFFGARNIAVGFTYIRAEHATYDFFFSSVLAALESKQAVEMSNTGHWFAIAGARTDQFNDQNGDGTFGAGDSWIADYNGNGIFDQYLYVNNPWPNDPSEGWEVFSESAGSFFISGDARELDSVILVRVIPEPSALLLTLVALGSLAACRQKRRAASA